MTEEKIEQIVRKYDTDREVIISESFLDGGIDPLFPRLSRAALDQFCQSAATISRYGIWANTVRDNIRQADKEIRDGNLQEAQRFLRRAANSLSAFSEIQAHLEKVE